MRKHEKGGEKMIKRIAKSIERKQALEDDYLDFFKRYYDFSDKMTEFNEK